TVHAERGRARRESPLQFGQLADVGDLQAGPPPLFLHQTTRLLEVLARPHRVRNGVDISADVDGYHVGAVGSQPRGVRPALTAGSPGDEGDPLRIGHGASRLSLEMFDY